jgi:hypothetical protein
MSMVAGSGMAGTRSLSFEPATLFALRARVGSLLAFLVVSATAQSAAIYRCGDGRGGVLYTDLPCEQGAVLDVPKSASDPAAVERLQRSLAAFDKRWAEREAAEAAARERARAAAAERSRAEQEASRREQSYANGVYTYAYPYVPYFAVPVLPPRARPHEGRAPRQGFVPAR